jgi:hypothetical protein
LPHATETTNNTLASKARMIASERWYESRPELVRICKTYAHLAPLAQP